MTAGLPGAFEARMRELLGPEAPAFFDTYRRPPQRAVRANPLKLDPASLPKLLGIPPDPVPWCLEAWFLPEGVRVGDTLAHAAGLGYVQEPSALAVGEALDVRPGQRVLDLAGPGRRDRGPAGRGPPGGVRPGPAGRPLLGRGPVPPQPGRRRPVAPRPRPRQRRAPARPPRRRRPPGPPRRRARLLHLHLRPRGERAAGRRVPGRQPSLGAAAHPHAPRVHPRPPRLVPRSCPEPSACGPTTSGARATSSPSWAAPRTRGRVGPSLLGRGPPGGGSY